MLDINKYLNIENRAGVRTILEKYTDVGEDADDLPDDYVDFIIQTVTADAASLDIDEGDIEACMAALSEDPDNDAAYTAFANCLRFVKLVYFDKKDAEGVIYPLLQEDEDNAEERAFPVYTRKKAALNPEFKSFRSHRAEYAKIAEITAGSGCDDIVINPDTDCFLFNIEETVSYVGACMETSDMFQAILLDGIEGTDLIPLVCDCLDGTSVICNLKDGTQVTGVLVLPRTEISEDEAAAVPDADSFTIIKDIEADAEDKDLEEVQILKADVSSILQAPDGLAEEPAEDEDPEEAEDLN
ncbi:MAG: SseB family protein [Clostridia bacterium]|nr:SseB family protein [Clostridia bacterium]